MSLLFRSLELHFGSVSIASQGGYCFFRCPAVHATGIRLHLSFTMPIKCRHPNGTTHSVAISQGDVICSYCERVFPTNEATPEQVVKARNDAYDVAYQAPIKDLLWILYLDDPSRPHDRQKPKNGPWQFPPGTRLVDPDSSCIPCFKEADMPATLRAAGFRAVRDPDPASNFVSIQKRLELCVRKPPGLCDEEDRKEEGTDKGAPESSEKNTSVYIRI
jgi:hypothetical protein